MAMFITYDSLVQTLVAFAQAAHCAHRSLDARSLGMRGENSHHTGCSLACHTDVRRCNKYVIPIHLSEFQRIQMRALGLKTSQPYVPRLRMPQMSYNTRIPGTAQASHTQL